MHLDGRLGSLVHLSPHVSAMNDAVTHWARDSLEHTKAVVSSLEALTIPLKPSLHQTDSLTTGTIAFEALSALRLQIKQQTVLEMPYHQLRTQEVRVSPPHRCCRHLPHV